MDTIGLDLHKIESQLCIGQDDGTMEARRIATTRELVADPIEAFLGVVPGERSSGENRRIDGNRLTPELQRPSGSRAQGQLWSATQMPDAAHAREKD